MGEERRAAGAAAAGREGFMSMPLVNFVERRTDTRVKRRNQTVSKHESLGRYAAP